MSRRTLSPDGITPEVMLRAYAIGVFPMAESATDPWLHWIEPRHRGIIPLDGLAITRRLAKTIRSDPFDIRIDSDFSGVIKGCALSRPTTWISERLSDLYHALFQSGYAHSVEAWHEDQLVGGLYGIHLGGAFFGESMFHFARDASKVALAHLVARLIAGGFRLLDTQFLTPHLQSLGGIEIDRAEYRLRLDDALGYDGDFHALDRHGPVDGAMILSILNAHHSV